MTAANPERNSAFPPRRLPPSDPEDIGIEKVGPWQKFCKKKVLERRPAKQDHRFSPVERLCPTARQTLQRGLWETSSRSPRCSERTPGGESMRHQSPAYFENKRGILILVVWSSRLSRMTCIEFRFVLLRGRCIWVSHFAEGCLEVAYEGWGFKPVPIHFSYNYTSRSKKHKCTTN